MTGTKHLTDGRYLSWSTRKANHVDVYFGAATIWPSQRAYLRWDCENTVSYKNIHVGNDKSFHWRDIEIFIANAKELAQCP